MIQKTKNKDGAKEIIASAMATLEDTKRKMEYEAVEKNWEQQQEKRLFKRKGRRVKKK